MPGTPVSLNRPFARHGGIATRGWLVLFACLLAVSPARAQAVRITEFVADNVLGLKDEEGDTEDWIELHNAEARPVDLSGWALSDEAADRSKWVFPAVTLGAGEYLVVFASGKDRRAPGRTLHTSFRLSASGEYLGLFRPDGTVASQFAPAFPAQPPGVAFGTEEDRRIERWVGEDRPARWQVPTDDRAGTAWRLPEFDDSAWREVRLGLGWDQAVNASPVGVADSTEDWSATGEQGVRGWFHGVYVRSRDSDATYAASDFVPYPPGAWDGFQWRSPGATPTADRWTRATGRPTGTNSGEERWVIRRWISSVSGEITVTWRLAKVETAGTGVSARLFHRGVQRDSAVLAASNTAGVTRTVTLTGVQVGDPIDLALLPGGPNSAADDVGDESEASFSVTTAAGFKPWIRTDVGADMRGIRSSAYVRVPFVLTAEDLAAVETLDLSVRFSSGIAAFLNGEPAGRRNAPVEAEGGVVTDSLQDWSADGIQGSGGWYQGFYRWSDDADRRYDPVTEFEVEDPQWAWGDGEWRLGPGDPPWTAIGRDTWHPNGNGGGANVHWAIRRWVAQTEGRVRVSLAGAKQNTSCGNGVTFRLLFNGTEEFARTIAYNDATGFAASVDLDDVRFGDRIDFVLDPTGTDGDTADGCDGSTFVAQVHQEAAAELTWNSAALAPRARDAAVREEVFSWTRLREHLVVGTNVLALQILNATADSESLLLAPEIRAGRRVAEATTMRFFPTPTPGAANAGGVESPGPVVVAVEHEPKVPDDAQPIRVRALVRKTVGAVASVNLVYRVQFGAEVTVPMSDDGRQADGTAGDGWWGAQIPASAASPGQMVRWAVVAGDDAGRTLRSPAYLDPRRSPQYFGTVVRDPSAEASALPVLHWFLQNPTAAEGDTGTRGSLFYDGEFYDNVGANAHGQSTRGFPKRSYDLDFNPGHHFQWQRGQPRVDDLNLLTTWADKSHFRTVMAYETYAAAGAEGHFAFPVRVQLNSRFHSVANLVENGDENFLERLGLDPQGALYKMYNTADSTSGAEKKTRKSEGSQDLAALISGFSAGTAQAREAFLFDQLDVPQVVNYLAARAVTADSDCCHKNYYLYRDTRNSGEWMAFPWDVDLTFGRVWTCNSPCFSYFDETIYTNTGLFVGDNNRVFSLVLSTPATRQMYLRRVRSLLETLTQPPEVAPSADRWRLRTLQWRDRIAPDAALDLAKWGTWGRRETITQAVDRIHREFLPGRRLYAFRTLAGAGTLPAAQSPSVVVRFGAIEARPSSGVAGHEYLCLTNPNPVAVDLSDWRLDGSVRFTFRPGTVLPARAVAYVSPDRRAFRARTASPKGGERRLVLGNYEGELGTRGGRVELLDAAGRRVAGTNLIAQPSALQQFLRVTELHFHPVAEGSEFIELMNTGAVALDLSGVRFTEGIQHAFAASGAPALAPGERAVLVGDLGAFRARHGQAPRVLGVYTGSLGNGGERLRLEEASGEAILDFAYPGQGFPATEGLDFSLVVHGEQASWEQWAASDFWRVGAVAGGTPGAAEPQRPDPIPVILTEVLTHTDPPLLDAVELFNRSAQPVPLGGWWLTDDRAVPRKYRIPAETVLAPGARLVVDESSFNAAGAPSAFTFSSHGEEVWLFEADASGRLTGRADGFPFPASANGVSFGRYTNSVGRILYPAQSGLSLGGPESGPRTGPVVLHEIMPAPAHGGMPFIELRNTSGAEVPLFDPAAPTNTWRLSGVDFDFPPGVVLPPGGLALVVGGAPREFREAWGIPAGVPVLGPWSGILKAGGERLALLRPDSPDLLPDGSVLVPYLEVDAVEFSDGPPWPALGTAGRDRSIERVSATVFGDDPASWRLLAEGPTPGTFGSANRAPRVEIASPAAVESARFPVEFELVATVTDDGLPDNSRGLILGWAQGSGPGRVEFSQTDRLRTLVRVPGPGRYRVRLTAFDGELSGVEEVELEAVRPPAQATMVEAGSGWRYWDQGAPPQGWFQREFDDRAWPQGAAQLGYGDGDEATLLRSTLNGENLRTAYFRRAFVVARPQEASALLLRVMRDDGALVWLNGVEAMRSNVPEGPLTYLSLAPVTMSGTDESAFFEQAVEPSLLRAGTNVLAVEVHQQNAASSDISFDLELHAALAAGNRAPEIDAGSDRSLRPREDVVLDAVWSDDGLPVPAALSWRQVAGPASAEWLTPTNAATVRVRFPAEGRYRLEASVSDGEWTVADALEVEVRSAGGEDYASWRTRHFTAAELQDLQVSGDAADPDRDGQGNRAEFESGTDPRELRSVLRLRVGTVSATGLKLFVPQVAGRSYSVQVQREPGRGAWEALMRLQAADGGEREVEVPAPGAGGAWYYRVVTPAP